MINLKTEPGGVSVLIKVAGIAQSVEQLIRNFYITVSAAAIWSIKYGNAGMAQSVERRTRNA